MHRVKDSADSQRPEKQDKCINEIDFLPKISENNFELTNIVELDEED